MSSRVVITVALRVRAIRTESRSLSGAASARRLLMPARETEAIILKTFPLGEADRLVSFLGRTSGRVRGVAAGARRIKNRYGSTLQVLSHVQLWYVEKETRELVRIQQCELLESFNKAQSDYPLSVALAVISEVSELVMPEHEASEPMFRLILLAAREIERTAEWTLPLSYFANWEAGLLCERCRRSGMKPLHRRARQLAERFTGERVDRIESAEGMKSELKELREASLGWVELHGERKIGTQELLERT